MPHIEIEFSNKEILQDKVTLTWRLNNTPVAYRWLERLASAQHLQYNIDDPERFYGFNPKEEEIEIALSRINEDIAIINSYIKIIDRTLSSVDDQDTLNYLHHVFEIYHGLLDQQDTDYWNNAPVEVQKALARLNIDVHRCEDAYRVGNPRFVVTYYGLPKDTVFKDIDYAHITNRKTFGTMYINYAEIGKTLADHYLDNDDYIDPNAFRPLTHCSADFNVEFVNETEESASKQRSEVWDYFLRNREKFEPLGCRWHDPKSEPGKIPVAELVGAKNAVDLIKPRQYIRKISIL